MIRSFRIVTPAAIGMVVCVGAVWATPTQLQAAPPPQRIVSLNLCADQYLLALADRSQIAGLTRNAADPEFSAAAARANGLHIMGESTEEILNIDPDLILDSPGGPSDRASVLAGRRRRVLELGFANNYGEILAQIREIAAAVGHPERGRALIARMNHALATMPGRQARGVAAHYQRRGYMTGTGTLIDDLMRRTGLINLAATLHKPVLSHLSLEELIAARPDYLIVESATDRVTDQGTEMLHHPLLDRIPRLRLPQAWTVCGGPAYVLAARSLSAQLSAARR